jgi:hypothetical protein
MFQTKVVEKIKTHILCSEPFFIENYAVYKIKLENYFRVGQTTENNMAHAHCMLVTCS